MCGADSATEWYRLYILTTCIFEWCYATHIKSTAKNNENHQEADFCYAVINQIYVEFVFNILKFQDSIFNNTINMLYHRVEISKILGKLLTPFLWKVA